MTAAAFPARSATRVAFAHVAYDFLPAFAALDMGVPHVQIRDLDALMRRAGDFDVLVVSGLWRNELLERAPQLRYVQSISAGTDQYDKERFRANGVRLANARGVNAQAVAEHAMALMLALSRHIHTGRDHQTAGHWRPMIGDPARREDELGGKTLLIVGLGGIGERLARLAKAFDMTVIATRRDPAAGRGAGDEVHADGALADLLPRADVVALSCPLTPATENLIDAAAFARMRRGAQLINVARGRVVDEAALIAALQSGHLSAAGIDVTREEPLAPDSPLWGMTNVLLTPHTGGETRRYEARVCAILAENLERLWRGETALRNEVV